MAEEEGLLRGSPLLLEVSSFLPVLLPCTVRVLLLTRVRRLPIGYCRQLRRMG